MLLCYARKSDTEESSFVFVCVKQVLVREFSAIKWLKRCFALGLQEKKLIWETDGRKRSDCLTSPSSH